jgi:hypothetical protein
MSVSARDSNFGSTGAQEDTVGNSLFCSAAEDACGEATSKGRVVQRCSDIADMVGSAEEKLKSA